MTRILEVLARGTMATLLTACVTSGSGPAEPGSADAGADATAPPAKRMGRVRPTDPGDPTMTENGGDAEPNGSDAGASVDAGPDGIDPMPQACGLSACTPGQPCADLAVDRDDLVGSMVIQALQVGPNDCSIAEQCVGGTGTRRLLRFDTATENIGTGDIDIGSYLQNQCFTFSQCHQHYHFRGVGHYTLYKSDGTTVAALGHKQGFCLEDVQPVPGINPPPAMPATLYTCDLQGLHVGYEDIYPANLDCQWIDITDVPAGDYVLSVVVNGDGYLPESDYTNNEARVPVTIPPSQ